MSNFGIIGEQLEKQTALAGAALKDISSIGDGAKARQLLPRAVFDMLVPYSAAGFFAERVVQSEGFNVELVQDLHSRLLPLERMADEMISTAKQRGYFDDPETAEPLHWLVTCNEQVKDSMVALESMLDPKLDDIMAKSMREYRRGETLPLESIL